MSSEARIESNEWKTGAEALTMCMICGGEYPAGSHECPDCHVSLSTVRRCPNCHKIVSAKHTRCVHCRSSFTHEASAKDEPAQLPASEAAPARGVRQIRAMAVSIGTFVFVFGFGMFFLRQMNKQPYAPHILASARTLSGAELRNSPSLSSSIVGELVGGAEVHLTGYRETDQRLWMAVEWNKSTAYLAASELSAPTASGADGATILRMYLLDMDSPQLAEGAIKAVESFVQNFPGSAQNEELRWVLAEHLRLLSQHAGAQAPDLRRNANQQYQLLANSGGSYGERAKKALEAHDAPSSPAPAPARGRSRQPRPSLNKPDGLVIIGGSGTEVSTTASEPHEALVLTQAEIEVRAMRIASPVTGAVLSGHVARPIKANGNIAIPAGAGCELIVLSADPSGSKITLALTSIEIDHHAYAVHSAPMELRSGSSGGAGGELALSFHLNAPLVIQH